MVRLKVVIFAALLAGIIFAQAGRAQTISVVQGNGQVICDLCTMSGLTFFDPLIVKVTDANGNPVANAQVTWSVTATTAETAGTLANPTTVTGSTSGSSAVDCNAYNTSALEKTGETCNVFTEGSQALAATNNNVITTVQASYSGQSVTFTLIQSPFARQGYSNTSTLNPRIAGDSPLQVGASISGAVGTVSSSPIKVLVQTFGGTPIPGVSVQLIPESPTQGGAAIACQTPAGSRTTDPGSVLTIGDGTALCYPVFTAAGSLTVNFDILVGGVASLVNPLSVNNFNKGVGQPAGFAQFGPFHVTATPNTPVSLQVVSGNNQSANAGAALGQPLVVQVLDSSGHALTGVAVNWAVNPSNAATVTPSGPSDNNGKAQASVTLASSATGMVTVTATAGSLSQSFSITVTATTAPLSSLTKVSGDGQSAAQGMAFGAPLVVMASSASGPVSNVAVAFVITSGSGSGSLSAAGGTPTQSLVVPSGSDGQASVTPTAGSTPGSLTITASVAGLPAVTFTLRVVPPAPPIGVNSFLNGAGFFASSGTNQTALSSCGVATLVVGSPLAPSAFPVAPNMYTTPLQQPGSTSISFQLPGASATTMAPILNITTASTNQQLITFQVPCELVPNFYNVTVTISGGTPVTVQGLAVRPGAPGIFETLGSDGVRRAIAVRPDGSIVSLSNPARRGENIRFYITGAGPVLPALASASLPTPGVPSTPTDPNQVVVGLNSSGVGGVMVQAATELIGVYEVTFQVPNDPTLVGTNNVLAVGVTALGNPIQYQQPGGSKLPIQ